MIESKNNKTPDSLGFSSSNEFPEGAYHLSNYVKFPSFSGQEQEAAHFFANLCSEKGLYVQFLDDEPGKCNFTASLYPLDQKKPNIIFLNHIDVVEAGELDDWEFPPFSGALEQGYVWGRGSYDNKGSAIVQFMAVSHFVQVAKEQDLPYNVTLLAVSGEEVFSEDGAKHVADNYLELLNPSLVIGEGPVGVNNILPSYPEKYLFGISVAHKHCLWLKLSLEIQENGHGSVPPKSYATAEMVKALNRVAKSKPMINLSPLSVSQLKNLGRLEGGVRGWAIKNSKWFKPLLKRVMKSDPGLLAMFADTATITTFKSDSQTANKISRRVEAKLDCRLMPGTSVPDFLARLRKLLHNDKIQIEILKQTPDAIPTTIDTEYYRALEEAIAQVYEGAAVVPTILPATVDSNFFRVKGITTYSSVPVKMSRNLLDCIHAPNERIPIQALADGPKVFINFLNKILNLKSFSKL